MALFVAVTQGHSQPETRRTANLIRLLSHVLLFTKYKLSSLLCVYDMECLGHECMAIKYTQRGDGVRSIVTGPAKLIPSCCCSSRRAGTGLTRNRE
jgi:hypothetical protein